MAGDIDGMMALFADDAELTDAGDTFRGKEKLRKVLEWDFELSPTATVDLSGMRVVTADHVAAYERVVHLMADGIPYDEPSVIIIEVDDQGLIVKMRSYHDKLALLHQIASKSQASKADSSGR